MHTCTVLAVYSGVECNSVFYCSVSLIQTLMLWTFQWTLLKITEPLHYSTTCTCNLTVSMYNVINKVTIILTQHYGSHGKLYQLGPSGIQIQSAHLDYYGYWVWTFLSCWFEPPDSLALHDWHSAINWSLLDLRGETSPSIQYLGFGRQSLNAFLGPSSLDFSL